MNCSISQNLPTYELDTIEAYLDNKSIPELEIIYENLNIPDDAEPSQLEIAVGQILLHQIQNYLPQWACLNNNGSYNKARKKLDRPEEADPLTLNPQLLLCINWADSGPGFSWPEEYYITKIPGFEKYIVTASRDSPDAWGCTDHAIGFCDSDTPIQKAASKIVIDYWSKQAKEWDQARWAHLFKEGLISSNEAESWADKVWCEPEEEGEDEEF